jgi:hypothetical protein
MPIEKLRYTLLEIEVVGGIKITQSGLMKWLYVVLYLLQESAVWTTIKGIFGIMEILCS